MEIFRFLIKVYRLTRPAKGRLALGILFGVLAGCADPAAFATAIAVVMLLFPTQSSDSFGQVTKLLQKHPWLEEHFNALQAHIAHQRSFGMVALVAAAIPAVMLLRGVAIYLNAYLMSWVLVRAIADLRARVFEHLVNLPLSFFGSNSTGELMSRVGDIGVLQSIVSTSCTVLTQDPFRVAWWVFVLLRLQWRLSLCAALFAPLVVIPISIYSKKGRQSARAAQTNTAGIFRLMQESFAGNRIIKAYNLEPVVFRQFRAETAQLIAHSMRMVRSLETPGPLIEFMSSVGAAALLLYFALQTNPSIGDFAVFVVAIFSMYRPVKAIVRLHSQLEQARGATERIFSLLATQSSLPQAAQPVPLRAAKAPILFDNVTFAYGTAPVLRNFQWCVQPGQMVALVGLSGSGKTTLTNLLLRFYDPTGGAIRIGGVDLRDVALRDLRSQIAIVTQEVVLFNETIRNNIAFGRPGASNAEIEAAAKHAHAHDFIMEKPQGYDTLIGERGALLSGGQRQRIAIARAILKDAPVLVLDEATSSLDNESERIVQVALDELMKGRTTICIAHRLSTVQHADVIIVLDQGKIVETGKHTDLLARGGLYSKLHAIGFERGLA